MVEVGPGGYFCPAHGVIEEPRPDLRCRLVLDNGRQAAAVYLPAPVVEKLTWLSLAGAVDLSESVKVGGEYLVEDKIRGALFGRYLKVYASPMSGQFYASDAEVVHSFDALETEPEPWTLKEDPEWIPTIGTRSFIAELSQVREIVKDGDEKMSPTYAVLPSGERAARFFWSGVLVDKSKREDAIVCTVNDPSGSLRLKVHRQYQSRAFQALQNIEAPALIAVAGKVNVYQPPDSDAIYVSLVPAELSRVDKATRLIWTEETLAGVDEGTETHTAVTKFIDEHGGATDE